VAGTPCTSSGECIRGSTCGAVYTAPDGTITRTCRRLRSGEDCATGEGAVQCDFHLRCDLVATTSDGRPIRQCRPLHVSAGQVGTRCTSPGQCQPGLECGAVAKDGDAIVRECRLARTSEYCSAGASTPACDVGLTCQVIGTVTDGPTLRECKPAST
jgi:hypothetical protein